MSIKDFFLDRTVIASFDVRGFERHQRSFSDADIPADLKGKVFLVTGANSGIGLAATRELSRRGGRVYMLCRNEERGTKALQSILAENPGSDCRLEIVDVSLRKSVLAFSERFGEAEVHGLLLNAGVLQNRRSETIEGIETTFATNVLGGFLLTQELSGPLSAGLGSVVHVSSGGMYTVKLSLSDWRWSRRPFDGVKAYAMTKRAQVVLAELLQEKLSGNGVSVFSMHPGWVDTPSVQTALPRFYASWKKFLRTPEQGADTAVWLLVRTPSPQPGGGFFFDRKSSDCYAVPFTRESQVARRELWELCGRFQAGLLR